MRDNVERHGHFIDGKEETMSKQYFVDINPANGKENAYVSIGGRADVDRAVQSAQRAYKEVWSRMDPADRGRILRRIADRIREEKELLAMTDTMDMGRPIYQTSKFDVEATARLFEYFSGIPENVRGATIPVPSPLMNYTRREPYGVVGAIVPWNYPMANVATKVAPALACGNTVVLKPAEQAPLSALILARIAIEEGMPPGVFNVVQGEGETGAALVEHPDVQKIAFTGSSKVGQHILANSQGIKSITLELGGKTANIIFPDCSLDEAVEGAVFTVFNNQGQTCTAGTRLLVHEDIAERFIELMLDRIKGLRVGNPMDMSTHIGPVVSEKQFESIERYVRIGIEEGAKLIAGGERSGQSDLQDGLYWSPTVFTNVRPDMRIAKEEIFGSVLSIMTFTTEEEALRIANDTSFGLATTLWTNDLKRAHRLAEQFESGIVWINTAHTLAPGSPYGGYKDSGVGSEEGLEAMNEYMRLKTIWINLGDYKTPFHN